MSAAGAAISGIGNGIADLFASSDYSKEASIYEQDIQLAKESTALKLYAEQHQALSGIGAGATGYAGGNLKTAGSAVDVLAESARLASLNKSQIQVQGTIDENNFREEQMAAQSQATTSMISGITSIGAGLFGGGG